MCNLPKKFRYLVLVGLCFGYGHGNGLEPLLVGLHLNVVDPREHDGRRRALIGSVYPPFTGRRA